MTEHRVRIPLRVGVGGLEVRDALLVEGPAGWGECSPLPGPRWDPAASRAAAHEAAFGEWPPPVRDVVEVNALVPAVAPHDAARLAAEAAALGFGCVKVKVGDARDVDRVAAVRDALGARVRIRVDANGAWSLEEAEAAVGRLARYDLELVEQPVARLEDLARLRRRLDVPVAADEGVGTVAGARELARLDAADVVVLKVQVVGGVAPALAIAEAVGRPVVVSSLLETSVGLAAGLALAAALPELPYACGLGTAALLAGDVVADPLVPERGTLRVRRVAPAPELLARYGVDR